MPFLAFVAVAIVGAMAAKENADNQVKLEKYNAKVAEQEAEAKRRAGKAQVDLLQDRKERMLASSRANTAKSGITSAGAPLLVDIESAELSAFDQLTARYNTQVDVNRSLSEANLYKYKASAARRAGRLAVAGAIVGGAAGAAGSMGGGAGAGAGTSLYSGQGQTGNLAYNSYRGGNNTANFPASNWKR